MGAGDPPWHRRPWGRQESCGGDRSRRQFSKAGKAVLRRVRGIIGISKFFLQLTLSLAATDCLLKGESPPPRAQLSEPAVDRVSGAESEETDTAPGPPPTTRCPEDVGGDRHEAAAPARDVRQRLVVVVVSVTEHHPKVVAVQRVFQDLEVVLPVLGQRQ